tara:strand:+ start:441 stop:860 length:420 start_codon:yes stop_codon:yes gene_type:complete
MSNQRIKLSIIGKLKTGETVESYSEKKPLVFNVGQQDVMPAIEKTAIELAIGESRVIEVSYEEAYGPYDNDKVQNITKRSLPKDISFVTNTVIEFLHQETNEKVPGIIKSVENDYIVVDFNHPLAGKDLIIEIKRLEAS